MDNGIDINERLLNKIEKMDDKINNVDRTLIRNTASLELHMERTRQNEDMINLLREDMKPIKRHVAMVDGVLRMVGILASLASIAVGVYKIFFES